MNTCVTFITGHYYASLRKAGFHNLADAAHRLGCKVNFVTAGYSLLSYLRRDYRTRIPGIRDNHNRPLEIKPGFVSYVHFTPWHPHTLVLPFLNKLSMPFMDRYGHRESLGSLLELVKETDIFVFESMSGLFLYKHFARENPAAKTIYRVSDDVRILRSTHPRLLAFEREIAPCFDCISVPNSCMQDKFPALSSLRLDLHGIDKDAYNACLASPYEPGRKNVVFVGTGYLDYNFILHVATGNPDCLFHLIGPLADKLQLPNVCFHGEMAFAQTIPYVKYADVGLHSLLYRNESSKSFSDSLKILQYRYCGLPIVSPDFMDLRRNGVFYYRPDDAKSCVHALRAALAAGNDPTRAQEVRSWTEVMQSLLDSVQSSWQRLSLPSDAV